MVVSLLRGRFGRAVLLAGLGAFLGGCASDLQKRYDLAIDENEELRRRVIASDSARESLEVESRRLREENQRLDRTNTELSQALREISGEMEKMGQNRVLASNQPDLGQMPSGVSVSTRGTDVVIGVAGDVLFAPGQATIRNEARATLDRVVSVIRQRYPNNTIRVEGHTDSDPIRRSGWKSNDHLGAERAITVQQYLIERGVPRDRIYSASFGPTRPRGTKAESRRVEIVVLGPGQ